MSLSKQQMLGAIGAGVFVLCAGGLGFGVYMAWDGRSEAEEELEAVSGKFKGHYSAPVFPSKKSLDSVKSNLTSYATWYDAAVAHAARGDRRFADETPPFFMQRLQGEVRRMLALTGGVEGRIANPAFLFGFEQYLGEGGVLPKSEDVPRLVVQLDTISSVVDILADAGILELKAIKRLDDRKSDDEEDGSRNRGRKPVDESAESKESCLKYAFEFTTRPAALVASLNQLTANERFMTVQNLSFRETADVIVEHLSAAENAENQKNSGGSANTGRRRGRRVAGPTGDTARNGAAEVDPLVIDPELDAPILVSFVLEVRDFGRATSTSSVAEGKPAGEASAEGSKAVEKKGDGE